MTSLNCYLTHLGSWSWHLLPKPKQDTSLPADLARMPDSKVTLDGGSETCGVQEFDTRDQSGPIFATHTPSEVILYFGIQGIYAGST